MKISFELTDRDLQFFRKALKQSRDAVRDAEDIEIIDADLGLAGAAAELREGFKEVVAQVTLGQVGIILSSEVTRLSRNCTDWYPLLDICGYKNCLIADRDGIYDPTSVNGRFLLGLKGQLSEMELHTIRARMTEGLLNKARRGELALRLPIGLVRDDDGTVRKDPNQEVQERVELVFSTFLRLRSAAKVLRFCNQHSLWSSRQRATSLWKRASARSVCRQRRASSSTNQNPALCRVGSY